MKENRPIASAEARFLDNERDLVSLGAAMTDKPVLPPLMTDAGNDHRAAMAQPIISIVSAAVILPLIAFSLVSGLLGRLIVLSIITSAIAANRPADLGRFANSQHGWKYATV